MSAIPSWFNPKNYNESLTTIEWAYEIWVRANYYRCASPLGEPVYRICSGTGPLNKMVALLIGSGLPASKENYIAFLKNRDHFKDYFLTKTRNWDEEIERPGIEVYETDDILPKTFLNELPERVEKNDLVRIMDSWCEKAIPIGLNLEKTNDELVRDFKLLLNALREHKKEFFSLKKSIEEQTQSWSEFHLLALFDLLYWREAFDQKLTYTNIGTLLWPDEEVSIEQRVIRTGAALIDRVFSESVAKALYLAHLKTV